MTLLLLGICSQPLIGEEKNNVGQGNNTSPGVRVISTGEGGFPIITHSIPPPEGIIKDPEGSPNPPFPPQPNLEEAIEDYINSVTHFGGFDSLAKLPNWDINLVKEVFFSSYIDGNRDYNRVLSSIVSSLEESNENGFYDLMEKAKSMVSIKFNKEYKKGEFEEDLMKATFIIEEEENTNLFPYHQLDALELKDRFGLKNPINYVKKFIEYYYSKFVLDELKKEPEFSRPREGPYNVALHYLRGLTEIGTKAGFDIKSYLKQNGTEEIFRKHIKEMELVIMSKIDTKVFLELNFSSLR